MAAIQLLFSLSVAIPFNNELETSIVFLSCLVLVEGRELLAVLVFGVLDFNMVVGMDWLAKYYAIVDCREKEVIFRIPDDEEFRFRGNKSSMP